MPPKFLILTRFALRRLIPAKLLPPLSELRWMSFPSFIASNMVVASQENVFQSGMRVNVKNRPAKLAALRAREAACAGPGKAPPPKAA